MAVNPVAAAGFGAAASAELYERSRPSYPVDAVDRLCQELHIGPGRVVLDLAAGTGKLTRLLNDAGATIIAVEPSPAMRKQFAAVLPSIEIRDGTAEDIPLADGSVHAVTVAQAFRWFDADAALAEIARVLGPGGAVGLIWNERDESVPWVAELSHVMQWDVRMPYRIGQDFRAVLDRSGLFASAQRARFTFEQQLTHDQLVDLVATRSYIAAMPPPERTEILNRVKAYVGGFPEPVVLPYVTDLFWAVGRSR
ncbi:MAG TPA: class I SAM-dependent methyltransferase [Acidimicrobiales bacterium]|nr:class I SAM-dependent methyltransferase [Acidimicrobiales bacterium]